LTIKAENGNLIFFVEIKRHVLAGLGVSPYAVLGSVKGDQLHSRGLTQDVDIAPEEAVHTGRIGDEADLLSPDQIEPAFQQNLDAQTDSAGGRNGVLLTAGAAAEKNDEQRNKP
jgi:hypothetical protein